MQSQEMSTNPRSDAEDAQRTDTLESSAETPTNIIFLIGDGMGTSQVSAAYFFQRKVHGQFLSISYPGLINTTSGSTESRIPVQGDRFFHRAKII